MWKTVHPVYSAGVQTHDLHNMCLISQPLHQGSRQKTEDNFLKAFSLTANC